MPVIRVETRVQAPLERCFDLARDMDLHQRSMAHTGERAIAGRTTGLIGPDEEVTWEGRHFGLLLRHTARITQYERPRHFRDSMVEGRFTSCHGSSSGTHGTLDELTICTLVHTLDWVRLKWEPTKAIANIRKHGIEFADAATIFDDELATTLSDDSRDETRYVTIGVDMFGRLLVVVYAWEGEDIRRVSARHATGRERRQYEEGS